MATNESGWHRELSRADLVLLCLPVLFAGLYGLTSLVVDTQTLAVMVPGLACSLVVGDQLFVHPPTQR